MESKNKSNEEGKFAKYSFDPAAVLAGKQAITQNLAKEKGKILSMQAFLGSIQSAGEESKTKKNIRALVAGYTPDMLESVIELLDNPKIHQKNMQVLGSASDYMQNQTFMTPRQALLLLQFVLPMANLRQIIPKTRNPAWLEWAMNDLKYISTFMTFYTQLWLAEAKATPMNAQQKNLYGLFCQQAGVEFKPSENLNISVAKERMNTALLAADGGYTIIKFRKDLQNIESFIDNCGKINIWSELNFIRLSMIISEVRNDTATQDKIDELNNELMVTDESEDLKRGRLIQEELEAKAQLTFQKMRETPGVWAYLPYDNAKVVQYLERKFSDMEEGDTFCLSYGLYNYLSKKKESSPEVHVKLSWLVHEQIVAPKPKRDD